MQWSIDQFEMSALEFGNPFNDDSKIRRYPPMFSSLLTRRLGASSVGRGTMSSASLPMLGTRMSMTGVPPPSKLTDADKATISSNIRSFLDQFDGDVAAKVGSTQNLDKRMKAKDYRTGPFTNRKYDTLITGLPNDVMVAEAEGFAKDEMERQLEMRRDNSRGLNKRRERGSPDGSNSLGRGGKYRPCFTDFNPGSIYFIVGLAVVD